MIKLGKKKQGKKKTEYKIIYDNTCTFLIQRSSLLSVIYSIDNHHKKLITNWKCFEIVVKI